MKTTSIQELTLANLATTVEAHETVVIDFWAPRCTTCARFRPIFADVAQRFDDVVFGTVNTDDEQDLAAILCEAQFFTVSCSFDWRSR